DIFPIYDKFRWLDDFCAYYEDVRIPFHIQLRAEYIQEGTIKQLKAVGLHGVTFAIETGNESMRRNGLKKRISNGRIVEAAEVLHRHGIKLRTENMIGVPSETWGTAMQTVDLNTWGTAMQTVDLNVRCNPEIGWASLYQPYPGTELGDKCVRDGLFDGDLDALSGSFFDTYKLDVPDGRKYERLQKLFSFFVEHPRLRFMIPVLVRIRLDGLYKQFYGWYKKRLYRRLYRV
ncbi:MAG: radical SAM protein, partial [Planctomycetota bacterium]